MTERTTQSQFLASVRNALGRTRPVDPGSVDPPAVDDTIVRLVSHEDDVLELFAKRSAGVGMDVRRCSAQSLTKTLIQLLDELRITKLVTAVGTVPQAAEFPEAFRRRNITTLNWRGDRTMAPDFEAGASLTDVAAAIAETGSIVYRSDVGHGRGLMLVPPVHIAIVRRADIVADLLDLFRRQAAVHHTKLPAAQSIITGPSKTADIEGVLVTGVHGPGKVVVLLVDN